MKTELFYTKPPKASPSACAPYKLEWDLREKTLQEFKAFFLWCSPSRNLDFFKLQSLFLPISKLLLSTWLYFSVIHWHPCLQSKIGESGTQLMGLPSLNERSPVFHSCFICVDHFYVCLLWEWNLIIEKSVKCTPSCKEPECQMLNKNYIGTRCGYLLTEWITGLCWAARIGADCLNLISYWAEFCLGVS